MLVVHRVAYPALPTAGTGFPIPKQPCDKAISSGNGPEGISITSPAKVGGVGF